MRVSVPGGYGAGYALTLYQFGSAVATAAQNVSYPAPTLEPNSLRQNRTGYSSAPTSALLLDTSNPVTLQLNGTGFSPNPALTTVTYGPVSDPAAYVCTLLPALSSTTLLTCQTQSGSQGLNLLFTVTVSGQSVVGTDRLSFPVVPTVTSIVGCAASAANPNATTDCSTEGGAAMTVRGEPFVQEGISVSIGGSLCANPVVLSNSLLTCTLPAGAGALRSVIVTSNGQSSIPVFLVSYAAPTITALSSANCSQGSTALRLTQCPNGGAGAFITVHGLNFGFVAGSPPAVLIGATLSSSVVQDAAVPHRRVVVALPPGVGLDRAVVVLQSGGAIGASTASLSYLECAPGTFRSGLNCPVCAPDRVSSAADSPFCSPCSGGQYPNPSFSACVACEAGKASPGGEASCSNCTAGSAAVVPGLALCNEW